MRAPRLKKIRKMMKELEKQGYTSPYTIFADHAFLAAYSNAQMKIKNIESMLNGHVRIYTTLCEYKKCKKQTKNIDVLEHVRVKKCGHKEDSTVAPLSCISDYIQRQNPDHYILAVSHALRSVKDKKNTPVIYMQSSVLSIDIPNASREKVQEDKKKTENNTGGMTAAERDVLEKMYE